MVRALVYTYALLDEGSTVTILDSKIARDIGLKDLRISVNLKGITNQRAMKIAAEKTNLYLENSTGKHFINNVLVVDGLSLLSQTLPSEITEICKYMMYIEINCYKNATPKILLEQDN